MQVKVEIIIRSRSHTPIDEMSDTMSPIPLHQSRHSTPIIEPTQSRHSTTIIEPTQSRHSTPIIETAVTSSKRVSFDNRNTQIDNIEAMVIKLSKQMRVLYELHKTSLEKINRLQTQIKKMTNDKNNELSSKVFSVSNNLVCIITFRYLTL